MAFNEWLSLDALPEVVLVTDLTPANSTAGHALVNPARVVLGAFRAAADGELTLPLVLCTLRVGRTFVGRLRSVEVLDHRLHHLADPGVSVVLRHSGLDELGAQSCRQRTDFPNALQFLGALKEA